MISHAGTMDRGVFTASGYRVGLGAVNTLLSVGFVFSRCHCGDFFEECDWGQMKR
jgi:hypothetical protein